MIIIGRICMHALQGKFAITNTVEMNYKQLRRVDYTSKYHHALAPALSIHDMHAYDIQILGVFSLQSVGTQQGPLMIKGKSIGPKHGASLLSEL